MTLPVNHSAEYRSLCLRQLHAQRFAALAERYATREPNAHEIEHRKTRYIAERLMFPRLATIDGKRAGCWWRVPA